MKTPEAHAAAEVRRLALNAHVPCDQPTTAADAGLLGWDDPSTIERLAEGHGEERRRACALRAALRKTAPSRWGFKSVGGCSSRRQCWCGPQRRHQHACRQAWHSLQPALQTLNRTLLMANLPPPAMRAVNRYNRDHRTEQN